MTKRGRLIHFLTLDSGLPLCGGGGTEPEGADPEPPPNGVAVCADCARRLSAGIEPARPPRRTPLLRA